MAKPETATLSGRFQVTLPKALQTSRQWQPGQEFAILPKGHGVLFIPIPACGELADIARNTNPGDDREHPAVLVQQGITSGKA